MTRQKHPFDVAAEQLEAMAGKPVAAQEASADYWELAFAADDSVGDFPQALLPEGSGLRRSDNLGADGFPAVAIPEQTLQATAHWTDVLSSNLWSEGYLLNKKALTTFRQSNLGEFREYPAAVRDQTGPRSFTYLHIRNVVPPADIDFGRSFFYITDMLGLPSGPVSINSFEDWKEKVEQASAGELDGCEEFSSIDFQKLYFAPGRSPAVDLFRLGRLSVRVYISVRLRQAILESGITGLEIKPNKRLFAGYQADHRP